jgi:hypothetical protein
MAMSRRQAELKRDPHDLVLTGKGTPAQERKRDPGDLLTLMRRSVAKRRKRHAPMGNRHHRGKGTGRPASMRRY